MYAFTPGIYFKEALFLYDIKSSVKTIDLSVVAR